MYTVELANEGAGTFSVKARDNAMVIEPMGEGFSPAEVLLASLGSCIGFFVRRYAQQSKLDISRFVIRLESGFSKKKEWWREGPLALNEIKVSVDTGDSLDFRRREILQRYIRHCPIKSTLEGRPRIAIEIK